MLLSQDSQQRIANQKSEQLPAPQKRAVVILAALAVLIVVFWIWQMLSNIRRPFDYGTGGRQNMATTTDSITLLKNTDLDGDGLSDYDELYVYKTSPYLEDTDSDGISDKQEIDSGTDPNCPTGKDCNTATTVATSTSANIDSLYNQTLIPTGAATTGVSGVSGNLNAAGVDQTLLQNAMTGQIDAASLRQLLISSGATKADLDKISDEDLMKSYQETLENQNQTQSQN